ncbi:MAG: hypothetical protein ACAH12_03565 [Methylophilaceae bacterium]
MWKGLFAKLKKNSDGSMVWLQGSGSDVYPITPSLTYAEFRSKIVNEQYAGKAFITDLDGALFSSDGFRDWPIGGETVLMINDIPFIICAGNGIGASTGLQWQGTTGGFSLAGTILPQLIPACFMWFPLNQIAGKANPAGWYYTEFSTTSAGIVYNNTYVSEKPAIPAVKTPFTGITSLAWLNQDVGADIQSLKYTPPTGVFGDNGGVEINATVQTNSSGNNKTYKFKLDGSSYTFFTNTPTTSTLGSVRGAFKNLRSAAAQIQLNTSFGIGLSGGVAETPANGTVNTALAKDVNVTQQIAVNTDMIILKYVKIKLVKSNA